MPVCLELGDHSGLRRSLETLLDQQAPLCFCGRPIAVEIDPRLALQPVFLANLEAMRLLPELPASRPAALLQRAAALALRGAGAGVAVRRHGALLLCGGAVRAEGFNHCAPMLGPRGPDPTWGGRCRTFGSPEEVGAMTSRPLSQGHPGGAVREAQPESAGAAACRGGCAEVRLALLRCTACCKCHPWSP